MDVYEKVISYLLDIEMKAQEFKRNFSDCTVIEINLEKLQDPDSVSIFFRNLGMEMTPYTREIVGAVVNQRQKVKDTMKIETLHDNCKDRINEYLDNCHKHGIQVPELSKQQHTMISRMNCSSQEYPSQHPPRELRRKTATGTVEMQMRSFTSRSPEREIMSSL